MWLLEAKVRQAIERAQEAGVVPSAEQQVQFEARHSAINGADTSRILTVAGSSAEIAIQGVITKAPSFLAMLFGGGNTTYAEIIGALAAAEQDPDIKDITFAIDSPGGQVDGLFDAIAAIAAAKKPTKAVVFNQATSAAFALAAQADEIVANNRAAMFGSIGVLAAFRVDENVVKITSSEAPDKAPDVTTPAGVAVVVEELDAVHQIFVEAIAEGRGTTVEKVNAEFGQGATLLADEALKRGMIDSVAGAPPLRAVKSVTSTTASGGNKSEAGTMDLKELQAQHPVAYAAAVKLGTDQERDRVAAHLTMGESSGDMKTALKAIGDGDQMTQALQATYMAAGINRASIAARGGDDKGTKALDGAQDDSNDVDPDEAVTALVEAKLGIAEVSSHAS